MSYYIELVILSTIITLFLRALPFLFFGKDRAIPKWLTRLGKSLPSTIMAILIIYCMKNCLPDWKGTGIPQVVGVIVVAISYKFKHNTFMSIFLGTAANMLLMRII